jgi:hypothetical protein
VSVVGVAAEVLANGEGATGRPATPCTSRSCGATAIDRILTFDRAFDGLAGNSRNGT